MSENAVLLTALGGPASMHEVVPFLTALLGREPTEEERGETWRKYLTVGGSVPLVEALVALAASTHEELQKMGRGLPVLAGVLIGAPSIHDVIASFATGGGKRLTVVDLSPVTCGATSAALEAARAEADSLGLEFSATPSIYASPAYMRAAAGSAIDMAGLLEYAQAPGYVLCVPEPGPDVDSGPDGECSEVAKSFAAMAGMEAFGTVDTWPSGMPVTGAGGAKPWALAYVTKSGGPITPSVAAVIEGAAASGADGVVFSPLGYALDDIEVLYDLDVLAAERALDLEMDYGRAVTVGHLPESGEVVAEHIVASLS